MIWSLLPPQGRDRSFAVRVERGRVIQVKGGAVYHDYLIGKEYGSKVNHGVSFLPFS